MNFWFRKSDTSNGCDCLMSCSFVNVSREFIPNGAWAEMDWKRQWQFSSLLMSYPFMTPSLFFSSPSLSLFFSLLSCINSHDTKSLSISTREETNKSSCELMASQDSSIFFRELDLLKTVEHSKYDELYPWFFGTTFPSTKKHLITSYIVLRMTRTNEKKC